LFERLVAEFPQPVAERIETRQRLADFAAKAENKERVAHWQREIVKADASAGAARTERSKYLAARASLALAAPVRDSFRALKLGDPLQRSLAAKRRALESALNAYKSAAAYNVAEVTTQASFEIAELQHQLAADLLASERPKKQTADVREQYDLMLEELATEVEDESIKLHELNIARVRDGIFDAGVQASYGALAKLAPARYGKTEIAGSYHGSLVLPVLAPPVVAGEEAAAAPVVEPPQPDARLVAQHERAIAQATAGQFTDAELEFKQLMAAASGFGGAAYNLGVLLAGQGKLDEAEAALREAAARTPRSAMALTQLGFVQRQLGKFDAAVASYEQALQADPEHAPAWRNLGVVRDLYLADPGAAVEPFERYKALSGEERPLTSWIADVKQRAGRREAGPPATPGEVQ
jgi:tetratricopeptide (TPR) repeat protein